MVILVWNYHEIFSSSNLSLIHPRTTSLNSFKVFTSIRKTRFLPTHIINNTTLIISNLFILLVKMLTGPPFYFQYWFLNNFDCGSFWVHPFQTHWIELSPINIHFHFQETLCTLHTSLLFHDQHFNVVSQIFVTHTDYHHQDGYHHHYHPQVALRVLCLGKDFDDMPSAFRQVEKQISSFCIQICITSFRQIYMTIYSQTIV